MVNSRMTIRYSHLSRTMENDLAIGAEWNNGNGQCVRMYEWDGNSLQLGNELNGSHAHERFKIVHFSGWSDQPLAAKQCKRQPLRKGASMNGMVRVGHK